MEYILDAIDGDRVPTRNVGEQEQLLRGYEGRLSTALALGWFSFLLGRETLPPLLPTLISAFSITQAQAGFVLSMMWAAYALSQFPGGRLSDSLTRKTVLVPSITFAVIGFVALALVHSFEGVLIAVCCLGIGGGAFFSSTRGMLTDLFTKRRAEAFGLQVGAGSVGSALASGIVVAVHALDRWKLAFLPSIVLLVGIAATLHRYIDQEYAAKRVSLDLRLTGKRLFQSAEIRNIVVVYSLFAFVWQGTMAFLPTFLQAEKGFSPMLAGGAFASLYVVGMVVAPISGNLGDRFGHLRVAGASLAVSVVGVLGALLVTASVPVFISVLVIAVGIRSYPPVMQAFALGFFPGDSIAGDFGAMKSVYTGIGSLGPLYVGIVSESMGYDVAFLGYALVLTAAIVVVLAMEGE